MRFLLGSGSKLRSEGDDGKMGSVRCVCILEIRHMKKEATAMNREKAYLSKDVIGIER